MIRDGKGGGAGWKGCRRCGDIGRRQTGKQRGIAKGVEEGEVYW